MTLLRRVTRTSILAAVLASGAAIAATPGAPGASGTSLPKPLEQTTPGEPGASAEDAAPRARDLPFTRENVLAVVRSHGDQLQECYEDAMAKRGANSQTAPAGRVVMSWTITLQGLASDVKVKKSAISDPLVTGCIVEAIRFWEFPRPQDPQPVEFPFDLKPVGGKKPGPKGT